MVVVSSWAVAKKRSKETERQIHPIGSLISVDEAWRKRLAKALDDPEHGMSQRALARRVGTTAGTISNLVTGRHPQARKSVIVAIHATFGWPSPTETSVADEAYRRIVDGALEISPQDRETVARLIESLKAAR